jgi:prepilin-type N-terminal cleavage/methylation domain-containing protein
MTNHHSNRRHRDRNVQDRGVTFIEILVSIVLLGTVVVATITALRVAVVGSQVDEDSSRAQAWLQAAADELHQTPYQDCDAVTQADILLAYRGAVFGATRPTEWSTGATIDVIDIQFMSVVGGNDTWGPYASCATASDPLSPIYPQLITIEVTDPSGDFVKRVEVIKSV